MKALHVHAKPLTEKGATTVVKKVVKKIVKKIVKNDVRRSA
jgi:hypothetical protein